MTYVSHSLVKMEPPVMLIMAKADQLIAVIRLIFASVLKALKAHIVKVRCYVDKFCTNMKQILWPSTL